MGLDGVDTRKRGILPKSRGQFGHDTDAARGEEKTTRKRGRQGYVRNLAPEKLARRLNAWQPLPEFS